MKQLVLSALVMDVHQIMQVIYQQKNDKLIEKLYENYSKISIISFTGIYAKIAGSLPWIQDVIKNAGICPRPIINKNNYLLNNFKS